MKIVIKILDLKVDTIVRQHRALSNLVMQALNPIVLSATK